MALELKILELPVPKAKGKSQMDSLVEHINELTEQFYDDTKAINDKAGELQQQRSTDDTESQQDF
jgi:hypothetical protein